nr:MAG: hypothetical protein ADFBMEEK_00084 [Peromyscus leucopus gammaherpesvirus]
MSHYLLLLICVFNLHNICNILDNSYTTSLLLYFYGLNIHGVYNITKLHNHETYNPRGNKLVSHVIQGTKTKLNSD